MSVPIISGVPSRIVGSPLGYGQQPPSDRGKAKGTNKNRKNENNEKIAQKSKGDLASRNNLYAPLHRCRH